MRIAVFGYYHQLNYGDDRIGNSMVRALHPHTIVLFPHNQEPPSMQWFDLILVGGGGLVWERVGIWKKIDQWLSSSQKPFGVIGLGINSLDERLKLDLLWVAEHAQLFVVRDQRSHQLLDNHPKVKVLPDLTWMFPYAAKLNSSNSSAIALSLASKHPQGYDPIAWGKHIRTTTDVVPFPLRFGEKHDSGIFQTLGFENTPHDFTINPLYDCNYLIGTRFHSIVFALQVGIPFIAILYDDKVRRVLADNDLLDLSIGAFDLEALAAKIDYLQSNTPKILARIQNVRHRLSLEGEQLRHLLTSCVQEVNQLNAVRQQNPLYKVKTYLKL